MTPGDVEITKRSAALAPNPALSDVTPAVPKLTTGLPVIALIANRSDPAVNNILLSLPDSQ